MPNPTFMNPLEKMAFQQAVKTRAKSFKLGKQTILITYLAGERIHISPQSGVGTSEFVPCGIFIIREILDEDFVMT